MNSKNVGSSETTGKYKRFASEVIIQITYLDWVILELSHGTYYLVKLRPLASDRKAKKAQRAPRFCFFWAQTALLPKADWPRSPQTWCCCTGNRSWACLCSNCRQARSGRPLIDSPASTDKLPSAAVCWVLHIRSLRRRTGGTWTSRWGDARRTRIHVMKRLEWWTSMRRKEKRLWLFLREGR